MDKNVLFEIKMLHNKIARRAFKEIKTNCMKTVSIIQMKVMAFLFENSDKVVFQKDIEKHLGLRRSTVSGILQTMEKNELVKRFDSESDARSKKIIITKKARLLHEQGIIAFDRLNKQIVEGISQEKLDVFFDVLKQMKENLE